MKRNTVVFITITDYDNLGVGYLAAILSASGYECKIIDCRLRKNELLKTIKLLDPLIIGFSIIYLNHFKKFKDLIAYLRRNGLKCHFTAGGHYASLEYEKLFQAVPQLDSIIRFEGEYPILDLARSLSLGTNWNKTNNIIYKENGHLKVNPVTPPEIDLDVFPFPVRSAIKEYAFQKKFTSILAGRGCVNNCSFCNTREFYHQAGGPAKRIRKPEMVVTEMNWLYQNSGCQVFLFHDDDFPVKSKKEPNWVERFCSELVRTGLYNKILWKINCRPDEIDEESFELMKRNGLFMVFLGLEDGTDSGLNRLNKQMTTANSLEAINIFKKLKIGFDFGFMLFQPETTFILLNENLGFLRKICGDGYSPVTFLKLIPLYKTRIEKELKQSGRLIHGDEVGDYRYYEDSMNLYYYFIMDCFNKWLRDPEGIENIATWARNYCLVFLNCFSTHTVGTEIFEKINGIISESNLFLLDKMEELSDIFHSGPSQKNKPLLTRYKPEINAKQNFFRNEIINTMAGLITYAEDQKLIN